MRVPPCQVGAPAPAWSNSWQFYVFGCLLGDLKAEFAKAPRQNRPTTPGNNSNANKQRVAKG
eukprot:10843198-Lingulodinium_polyedra.AAC.1